MGSGRCWCLAGCLQGVPREFWWVGERELDAGGWSNGGEPEEEVASGVVGVWEEVLGELGLVGGGAMSSGRSWWALGDAVAWLGVFRVWRGSSGGLGEGIGCRWLVEWW